MSRGKVSLLLAAGVAAAVLVAVPMSPASSAEPTGSPRQQEYAAAAAEFGVPESVLLGVSYLQSRWDVNAGRPSSGAGYGPMHLTDLASLPAARPGSGDAPAEHTDDRRGKGRDESGHAPPPTGPIPIEASLQTLDLAATLTGADRETLRTNPRQNIRGGAALLAHYQAELKAPRSADPGQWFGAVGRYGGADASAAWRFARDVFETIGSGMQRTTDDGQSVTLAAYPRLNPATTQLKQPAAAEGVDCPTGLDCEFIPAAYAQNSADKSDYGNYDTANRPTDMKIDTIIVHNQEGYYHGSVSWFKNPKAKVAAQYVMRASDGHIAQMVKLKDVGWQAGNWHVNGHSIGIEHEGFLAQGPTWFTEVQYRNSARLVRYLAAKYHIRLDRAHVYGHDNVPATGPTRIRGMHSDPGPYWDWNHYFNLLHAPIFTTGSPRTGMVTIRPDFAKHRELWTGCDKANPAAPCPAERGSTGVRLRTEPRPDAPLVNDPGINPDGRPSGTSVYDVGGWTATGQQWAVAERRGEWIAIWYLGAKAWLHNPPSNPTVVWSTGFVVTPKRDAVPTYGRPMPEAAEFPAEIPVVPIAAMPYTLKTGQRYVLGQFSPTTDYYYAETFDSSLPLDHTVVRGNTRYLQIFLGHRMAYVKAEDVTIVPSPIGAP